MISGERTLQERLDRLESLDEIRQLASKYALAVDMCDLDALVGLYTENVRVRGRDETGRHALRRFFREVLGQFGATAHQIGNHVIEFEDPDSAQGVVYCYAHQEMGDHWMVAQLIYHDVYERQQGQWFFTRRTPLLWYASHLTEAPVGPDKVRWPGKPAIAGTMHDFSPAWKAFRSATPLAEPGDLAATPIDGFLERLRRGQSIPRAQIP